MTDITAIATELFTLNPGTELYFFTSDGQAFEVKHDAYNHSVTLKDKTLTEVYRPGISEHEIEHRKQSAADELKADHEKAYRSMFPEIAALIDRNRTNHKAGK